jgi:hypothetical protein
VEFGVGQSQGGAHELVVYDVSGRRVRRLVYSQLEPGWYELIWDGRSDSGGRLSPGVYFARLVGPGIVGTRKIVVVE